MASTPRAAVERGRLGQVEVGQVRGLDLQHGHFQARIAAEELGLVPPPVVQGDGDAIGIEHVAQTVRMWPSGEMRMPLW